MTRLMFMTFWSAKRWEPGVHPHESPKVMTIPLVVLAALSVVMGVVMNGWIQEWLEPSTGAHPHEVEWIPSPIGLLTMAVVAVGVAIGWYVFGRSPIPAVAPATANPLAIAGRNDLFGDALNEAVVVRPFMSLSRGAVLTDDQGVDSLVNGVARMFGGLSLQGRKLQTGNVRSYALTMVAGAVLVGAVLILGQWA